MIKSGHTTNKIMVWLKNNGIQLMVLLLLLVSIWWNSWYPVYAAVLILLFQIIPVLRKASVFVLQRSGSGLVKALLIVFYYLILTPAGWFYRLAGNDPLLVKDKKKSVFTFRDKTYNAPDLDHPE